MKKLKLFLPVLFIFCSFTSRAGYILIPMDETQTNHLKAYGIAYWVLKNELTIEWLLNYRGGSFLIPQAPSIEKECTIRGVLYSVIANSQADGIRAEIADPQVNMDV